MTECWEKETDRVGVMISNSYLVCVCVCLVSYQQADSVMSQFMNMMEEKLEGERGNRHVSCDVVQVCNSS